MEKTAERPSRDAQIEEGCTWSLTMFDALEKRLVDWIEESRLNGHIVKCTAIQIRGLNLVKMPKFAVK